MILVPFNVQDYIIIWPQVGNATMPACRQAQAAHSTTTAMGLVDFTRTDGFSPDAPRASQTSETTRVLSPLRSTLLMPYAFIASGFTSTAEESAAAGGAATAKTGAHTAQIYMMRIFMLIILPQSPCASQAAAHAQRQAPCARLSRNLPARSPVNRPSAYESTPFTITHFTPEANWCGAT